MVPSMPPDIALVEKAQAEAPALLCQRQPDQEIGDLFVLVVQLGEVTIPVSLTPKVRQATTGNLLRIGLESAY